MTVGLQIALARSSQTNEQRKSKMKIDRLRTVQSRLHEIVEQRKSRLEADRLCTAESRSVKTIDQRETRRNVGSRRTLHTDLNLAAFHYNADYDNSLHPSVVFEKINKLRVFSGAFKFKRKLQDCAALVEKWNFQNRIYRPNHYLRWYQVTSQSKQFSANMRKNNSCFQMTSFGAAEIVRDNYSPSARANLPTCWIAFTHAGCRSQVSPDLFHGNYLWTSSSTMPIYYRY